MGDGLEYRLLVPAVAAQADLAEKLRKAKEEMEKACKRYDDCFEVNGGCTNCAKTECNLFDNLIGAKKKVREASDALLRQALDVADYYTRQKGGGQ